MGTEGWIVVAILVVAAIAAVRAVVSSRRHGPRVALSNRAQAGPSGDQSSVIAGGLIADGGDCGSGSSDGGCS